MSRCLGNLCRWRDSRWNRIMPQVEHPNSTKGGKQVSRVTKQNFVDSRRAGSFLERWDGRTTTSLLHCLSRQRVACCMPCAMAGNPCDPLWYQEGRSCPHGIHVPWHGIRRLIYIYIYIPIPIYIYIQYMSDTTDEFCGGLEKNLFQQGHYLSVLF